MLAYDLLITVVGVAVAQAVTRDAFRPCDAARAQDVVVVVLDLGQGLGGIAGAGEFGGGESLGFVDQFALFRGVDGHHPIPAAFGTHG